MMGHRVVPTIDSSVEPSDSTPPSSVHRAGRIVASFLAGLIHASLGVTVSVSGLIMPSSAVRVLALFWIGGVVAMVRVRHRPAAFIAVPVVSWAVWFAVAALGAAVLGWTA